MIAIVLGRIACNQNFRFKEIAQKMAKYVNKIMIHCTECMFLLEFFSVDIKCFSSVKKSFDKLIFSLNFKLIFF